MRVVSEKIAKEQNRQYFFDFEYKPEYQSFRNFRRWFTRPAGPFWKGGVTNVSANTVTDLGDSKARIIGGPWVKFIYSGLVKNHPPTS